MLLSIIKVNREQAGLQSHTMFAEVNLLNRRPVRLEYLLRKKRKRTAEETTILFLSNLLEKL